MTALLNRFVCRQTRVATTLLCAVFFGGYLDGGATAHAVGTGAGVNIQNTATAEFEINGVAQTPVASTVQTTVDELLDVVVVDDFGGPVAVAPGASGVLLQFTLTNNGNGEETYRIIADDSISEGGFNPQLDQIYLESNGIPGLQTNADTAYIPGSSDPQLAADETLVVYVQANIPGGLSQGANGDISLRAVSETIINQNGGLTDPDDALWPVPGESYATLGDGGGFAVVGTSNDASNLLMRTTGRFQVSDAVVAISKVALNVVDPFGGSTLVPGSIVTYQLTVTVSGSGGADNLVIRDPLPAELEYQPGTLSVSGVIEDDDFAPAGTDNSGFDAGNTSLVIDRGAVAGGSPDIVITFDAALR